MIDYEDWVSIEYVHRDRTIFPKRSRKKREERKEETGIQLTACMKSSLWRITEVLDLGNTLHPHIRRATQKNVYTKLKK